MGAEIFDDFSSYTAEDFLKSATNLFASQNTKEAILHIDLALTMSNNRLDYLTKKLELLHGAKCYDQYILTFTVQLKNLFDQLDLPEFCKFLGWYIDMFAVTKNMLISILNETQVPGVLVTLYKEILKNPVVQYDTQAYHAFANKNYKLALDFSQLALKQIPISLDLLLLQARCYSELKDYTNSIAYYDKVCNMFPTDKHAYLERGHILYLSGLYLDAILSFRLAVNYGYDERLCLEAIASCYYEEQDYNLAIAYYKRYVPYSTDLKMTHERLADCYQRVDNFRLAQKHIKLAKKY
ncbi:MAG: hypothetical protein ATN34_02830 [Epulopiscium sp. Nele67-Bin002]|nr:MAG: hypothetical protein BEN18_09405 [Epulopiscium sp. Nuni2H_MBin001]OON90836.1 MAG: hypothetical protein ATN34_02830 [Epulopiscium sp. Nele67-Bin002]